MNEDYESTEAPGGEDRGDSHGLLGRLRSAHKSSWFAWTGWMAGIVGIAFALKGEPYRDLRYHFVTPQSLIVKQGQAAGLDIRWLDTKIETDIRAAQIVLWNNGDRTIRSEDVVDSIRIVSPNSVQLLDFRLLKTTGDWSDIKLARMADNSINVNWRSLQRDEGAIIQLIYSGPEVTGFEIVGRVEEDGVPEASNVSPRAERLRHFVFCAYFATLLLMVLTAMGIRLAVGPMSRQMLAVGVVMVTFLAGALGWSIYKVLPSLLVQVPFGI